MRESSTRFGNRRSVCFLTDGPTVDAQASPLSGVLGPAPGRKPTPKGNGATECSTITSKACKRGRGPSSVVRRQPNKTGQARLRHPGGGAETGGRRNRRAAKTKARTVISKNNSCKKPPETVPFGEDRLVVFASILARVG